MHAQRDARQLARLRILLDEIKEDPHVAAIAVNEFARLLNDLADQRHFALITAANANDVGLEFMEIMGESAKMIRRK